METQDDAVFPGALLQRSPQDRLAYFKEYTVAHPHMERACADLVQAIREPANAAYILVIGPTGVGKTTLRLGVERRVSAALQTALDEDPGRLPICSTTAVSPDTGNFNWKDYYTRALQALSEPLIGDKMAATVPELRQGQRGRLTTASVADAPALRRALESALTHRRPTAFLIDEAQHLMKMASGRRLQDQMDCIKSLTDQGKTIHVLMGTYELLILRSLNGQMIRRGITIHFPRYHADSREEVTAFQRVLVSFEQQLPLREKPNLVDVWSYCFERSVGCVGVLKDWLTRAFATALAEDAGTLTRAHLTRHALTVSECDRLLSEALAGEEHVTAGDTASALLRARLRLPESRNAASGEQSQGKGASDARPIAGSPRTRRPGERRPTRDPIGQEKTHAG